MLFVLNCVLITLASATSNNVSSKPSDNKVSDSLNCTALELKKGETKQERKEREKYR